MKKACALCVCLAMLLGIGPAYAEESAVSALLAQWKEITQAEENALFSMGWALGYAKDYCESGSWRDLVHARAAAQAAYGSVLMQKRPERQLTPEQAYDLTLKGVETALVLNEAAAFLENQLLRLETLTGLKQKLQEDVFFSQSAKDIDRWVAIQAQWTTKSAIYHCLATNSLLLGLAEDPAAGAFWREMPEKYPFLGAAQEAWQTDQTALAESAGRLLDGLEALEQDSAKLVASASDDLLRMEAAYASGDWAKLLSHYRLIGDTPPLLPLPQGLNTVEATCIYYSQEDGGLRAIAPGDDLAAVAQLLCALQFGSFSHEALERYDQALAQCGASLAGSGVSETGSEQFRYALAQGTLTVIWQDGTLLLYYDPRRVGVVESWYYEAAQQL